MSVEGESKARRLVELAGYTPKGKGTPEIFVDELEKDIEAVIQEEARRLYRKQMRRRPPRELPQEWLDRGATEVMRRWQKTLREMRATIPKVALPPEVPPEFLAKGAPICPKCGEVMRKLIGTLWQCPKCYHTLKTPF